MVQLLNQKLGINLADFMIYIKRNFAKLLLFVFGINFLTISCNLQKNKKDYKCLSCGIYLYKNHNDIFSLYSINKNETIEKIIEGISKIYWIKCKGIVSIDSTYLVISKEGSEILISIGMSFSEVTKYFKDHFTENQDLKFDLCSSVYKFLPPRETCE